MNGCRAFRLSSVLFALLLLLLLLPCEAGVISIQLSVCNDIPSYVSVKITLVCGYSQGHDHDPNNNKMKVQIHHDTCGKWRIDHVAADRKLVCSVQADKDIPWQVPSFSVRDGEKKHDDGQLGKNEYPAGLGVGNDQNQHDPDQKQEQHDFKLKRDGVYVQTNGRDELVKHWQWMWPTRFDAYIHNKFSDGRWITVTCSTGGNVQVRDNLRPDGDPLLLELKMAASVHRGANCSVYWSSRSNRKVEMHKFYAFDVARVRDNIYYFHDGVRGILIWHLNDKGLYQWDDERKTEEKVRAWRTYRKRRNRRNRRRKHGGQYNYNEYPYQSRKY